MHLQKIHIVPALTASRCRKDGTSNIRLQINFKGKTAYIASNAWVKPAQWDKYKYVHSHPYAESINAYLRSMVAQYEEAARDIMRNGLAKNATAIMVRDMLVDMCQPAEKCDASILQVMESMVQVAKTDATKRIFTNTHQKICCSGLPCMFEDITPAWLERFDAWLMANGSPSRNARNIHLRNVRRAFNMALQQGLTTAAYPFKSFAIKPEPTPPAALTASEMRQLLNCDGCSDAEKYWLEMLALSFLLIGINMADLAAVTGISRNRINYTRQKTGKAYTIKVLPLAAQIINRHRSATAGRLLNILDKYTNVHTATNACAKHLKAVTARLGLPHVSWYTARYTWASIAANDCGLSVDTIALALGHTYGLAVTLGYISPDMGRVDEANLLVTAKVFE